MKKYLLSATVPMLAIVAGAVTYMQVKTTDDKITSYNVMNVDQIDFNNDSITSTSYMQTTTTYGKMTKFLVDSVLNVEFIDLDSMITRDTAGSGIQGVSVSGKIGDYTFVDLGLESGLLWATYNVGATAPADSGDYFAWGETKTKTEYESFNYEWYRFGLSRNPSKYYNKLNFGQVYLEPEDDAATANWGDPWYMPTQREQQELIDGCDWEWTDDFNGSGIAGTIGTSKSNQNTIFFPATGCARYNQMSTMFHGCWASSLSGTNHATASFFSYDKGIISTDGREIGRNVRAVVDAKPKNIVCFYTSDSILLERQKVVDGGNAIVPKVPTITDYNFIGWNDSSFTDIHEDRNFFAIYKKIEYITTISGEIGEYSYVDLGLPSGLKWAACNIGATSPEKYGDYIAWAETSPKQNYYWSNLKYSKDASGDKFSKYVGDRSCGDVDSLFVLQPEDDAAIANMGDEWYTPTSSDYEELIAGCDWKWISDYNETGIAGQMGISKANGNMIFFPASGHKSSNGLIEKNETGIYWTSTISSLYSYWAGSFTISNKEHKRQTNARYFGASIRAVSK